MHKVNNISEFIESIKKIISEISDKEDIPRIWFRGEPSSNIKTPLIPKLLREQNYDSAKIIESQYRAEFKREAVIKLKNKLIEINDWNLYFMMQHYGMPTRLLDWTESALISLYFAINSNTFKNDDKVVWVCNPLRWNKEVLKNWSKGELEVSIIYFPETDKKVDLYDSNKRLNLDEFLRLYLHRDKPDRLFNVEENKQPFCIYPYYLDDRMRNQASCFTIHDGEDKNLIDLMIGQNCLRKIVINHKEIKTLQKELKILGIKDSLVFPDLEGISRAVQNFE